MSFRVVRCSTCSHHLRPGARFCGRCGEATPIVNLWVRPLMWSAAVAVVALAVFAIQMAIG